MEDEYQLEDVEIVAADYMLKIGVSNFRNAWEGMGPECEKVDEYGLGVRESLAEAVSAVINILGMQPCEVSNWVWPPKILKPCDSFKFFHSNHGTFCLNNKWQLIFDNSLACLGL